MVRRDNGIHIRTWQRWYIVEEHGKINAWKLPLGREPHEEEEGDDDDDGDDENHE